MFNQSKLRVQHIMETLKVNVSIDHLHDDDENGWGDPMDLFDDEDDAWFDERDNEWPDEELLGDFAWDDEYDDYHHDLTDEDDDFLWALKN